MGKLANYPPYNTRLNSGFFYAYNMLLLFKGQNKFIRSIRSIAIYIFQFGNIKIWG